jgi:hypothetical protein
MPTHVGFLQLQFLHRKAYGDLAFRFVARFVLRMARPLADKFKLLSGKSQAQKSAGQFPDPPKLAKRSCL